MNKKIYLILILALVLIPIVSAQAISEGIERILGMIFDATEDMVYIKAAIWFVLFFLIFKSAERIFPQNRGSAAMMALVVAVVGARYMPEDYLEFIGGWYAIIIGIVFFLAPYFFGNIIGDLARLGRTGKTFLVLAFYGGLAYFIMKMEGLPVEGEAANALEAALAYISDHFVVSLIIIGVLCYFFLRRRRAGVMQPGGRGSGFWRGFGRGAGQAAGWAGGKGLAGAKAGAKAGATGLAGWMARKKEQRRQRLRQRAMLKAGWAKKEAQLTGKLSKMPGGKYIKKGTAGHAQMRRWQQQIARVREKQKKKPGFKKKT